MELGFGISIFNRVPNSLSCIPDSKSLDCGVHKQKFPGIRNPLHGGGGGEGWGVEFSLLFLLNKASVT